jgi:serine/threonine-protein kinase
MAATVGLGSVWWWLSRRRPPFAFLEAADTGVVLFISLLLNLNAGLYAIRTVSVFNLALVTGLVALVRAVVVPSTARRTLALGLIASAMAYAIFFLSAFHPAWPVAQREDPEWSLPFQLASFTLWLGACIATATVASKAIYHLRREVRAARQLGQYVVGEKLGEGGMGIVYRATHSLLRRETALKLLPPDRVDPGTIRRFEREVVETARLRHPNTVAVYDYGRTPDGVFYYAMEYLDGLTITELVAVDGPLPPGRVVWLLRQVCASLDEAHSVGLVHRDIKPANLYVCRYGIEFDFVKILDFGLVKSSGPLTDATLTAAGAFAGTPGYIAPEVALGSADVDWRADIYGLGCVGYFLVTGAPVFERASPIEMLFDHARTPPISPSQRARRVFPAGLDETLLACLEKDPRNRPQSAEQLSEALGAITLESSWTADDARRWWLRHSADRARPRSAAAPESAPRLLARRG